MAHNFLEQLIAEWYEFKGYFIRRNVLVGKRPKGGYECELDIVAFHPGENHLVHIEASMDAARWSDREKRFKKKFDAGKKYIPSLFKGLKIPNNIEQIAILIFASKSNRKSLGEGELMLGSELLEKIFQDIQNHGTIYSHAIPEQFPILRAFQFVAQYKKDVCKLLLPK